jgi:hypothetical protein
MPARFGQLTGPVHAPSHDAVAHAPSRPTIAGCAAAHANRTLDVDASAAGNVCDPGARRAGL